MDANAQSVVMLRSFFRVFNNNVMVPSFQLGLGPLIGNPLSGYIMVIKAVGHKTGRIRYVPVNYAILDGAVYCLAGFGSGAHWYRNLKANPHVALLMPAGTLQAAAQEVTDPAERVRAGRQILKNSGIVALLFGYNAFTAPDDILQKMLTDCPVVRFETGDFCGGAADPGGWLWILPLILILVVGRLASRRQ